MPKVPPNNAVAAKRLLKGISLSDIEKLASGNPSLRGYLQGYLAEMFLERYLSSTTGISDVGKIGDQNSSMRGDFKFRFKDSWHSVECKSFSARGLRHNPTEGGWSATVNLKRSGAIQEDGKARSVNVKRGEFDILAVSTFNVTGTWDFLFIHNQFLPLAKSDPSCIKSTLTFNPVTTPCLFQDILQVLPS